MGGGEVVIIGLFHSREISRGLIGFGELSGVLGDF